MGSDTSRPRSILAYLAHWSSWWRSLPRKEWSDRRRRPVLRSSLQCRSNTWSQKSHFPCVCRPPKSLFTCTTVNYCSLAIFRETLPFFVYVSGSGARQSLPLCDLAEKSRRWRTGIKTRILSTIPNWFARSKVNFFRVFALFFLGHPQHLL